MCIEDKDSLVYELFKKYEPALVAIGVDFSREDVQDANKACTYELEEAFRAVISYVIWLNEQKREYNSNSIFVSALTGQWKPIEWRDEYLNLPILQSQGQKWWESAGKMWGYELRNQLVSDIVYERGKEYILFTNRKEMLIQTAWLWGWERVLAYATSD